MCKECGCSITQDDHKGHHHSIEQNPQLNEPKTIEVISKILQVNDAEADKIREHLDEAGVFGVNLMSSPGAGKTSLLESLAKSCDFKFAVIEGDLQTNQDADRLKRLGIDAHQITTGTACHLDAHMVHHALHHLPINGLDVLFVENVGNLVCPASYDVGTHINVVLLSTPEGDDKVSKYPTMFSVADLVVISKIDLVEHFDFDIARVKKDARKLNPKVEILEFSTKDDATIKALSEYLKNKKRLFA